MDMKKLPRMSHKEGIENMTTGLREQSKKAPPKHTHIHIHSIVPEVKHRKIGVKAIFKKIFNKNVSKWVKYEYSDSGSPVNSKWGKWKGILIDTYHSKTAEPQIKKFKKDLEIRQRKTEQ